MRFYKQILIGVVSCHSNMLEPPVRGSLAPMYGYCSPERNCDGPCESPYSSSPYLEARRKTFSRGQTMPVIWLRQNHPGGFVRLAITQTKYSHLHEAFDSSVIKYTCFESGCSEDSENRFHGYKAGPNSNEPKNNATCSSTLKLPSDLEDGDYTLQWIWFAGGVNNGNNQVPFGTYYSCSDIKISGGNKGKRDKPVFTGGDAAVSRNDQCRYWGTADPRSCASGKSSICPYGPPKLGAPKDFLVSQNLSPNIPNDSEFEPPSDWKVSSGNWRPDSNYQYIPEKGYDPKNDKTVYTRK